MTDLKVKVDHIKLDFKNLLGASFNNEKTFYLINHIKSTDSSCQVYKPVDSDILNENDKWEVYMAFNDSLIFEFLKDKLIYIAFDLSFLDNKVISLPPFVKDINSIKDLDIEGVINHEDGYFQTIIDSDIVLGIILDEHKKEKIKVVAFGDLNVFSDEKNMPNRCSEILSSLGKFTV